MKTIKAYIETQDPYAPNITKVVFNDEYPNIPSDRRTFASGFSVPIWLSVPDSAEIAPSQGDELFLWEGSTPMSLQYNDKKETITAKPAMMSPQQATDAKAWSTYKMVFVK